MKKIIFSLFLIFCTGCETMRPVADSTPPEITIFIHGGIEDRVIGPVRGTDESDNDNCVNVRNIPVELTLLVSDAGGVKDAWIKAFPGTINPSSVIVSPSAPEATYAITTASGSDTLDITLTPPSASTVRTGASAIVEVGDHTPIAIIASASDYAGNVTVVPQFDLRQLNESVICSGDN